MAEYTSWPKREGAYCQGFSYTSTTIAKHPHASFTDHPGQASHAFQPGNLYLSHKGSGKAWWGMLDCQVSILQGSRKILQASSSCRAVGMYEVPASWGFLLQSLGKEPSCSFEIPVASL